MQAQYNVNNASVKRILREVKEMQVEPSNQYTAAPLEDNIFEWHFTIRGPHGTEFEGGLYHGRIILPPEYPFKPPNIVLLNQNGRFEVGTKICLSISSYHPEQWQPSWSIRTVLVALISFMPTKGEGAIGAIDLSPEDRKKLALKSVDYACDKCGLKLKEALPDTPALAVQHNEEEANKVNELARLVKFSVPSPSASSNVQTTTTPATLSPPPPSAASPSSSAVTSSPVVSSNQAQEPVQVLQPIQISRTTSSSLDYIILALLVGIVGLIVRKYL